MRFGIVLALLCSCVSLFSEEKAEEKIYLGSEQVAVHDNRLFVFVNGEWRATEAIFSDATGLYVLERSWYEPWDCGYCGATNPPLRLVCWNCGR